MVEALSRQPKGAEGFRAYFDFNPFLSYKVIKGKMKIDYQIFIYIIFYIFSRRLHLFLLGKKAREFPKFRKDKSCVMVFTANIFAEWLPVAEYFMFSRESFLITFIGIFIALLGLLIRFISIKALGSHFSAYAEVKENQELIKEGIYKHIRHPAYLGILIYYLGLPLVLNAYYSEVVGFILLSFAFYWRIKEEEKLLIEKFGKEYKIYMNQAGILLPKIWLK